MKNHLELLKNIFIYLFIYLAASGLSHSTRDLHYGLQDLLLLLLFSCCMRTLSCGMWDLVP